jgi:polygalacturonase
MISSTISDIKIINSPVQVFSINGAKDLTLSGITIDNSDGDAGGGHNTDAFDVGSSSGITITGATVYNQDDCLAVNSGTVLTKAHNKIGQSLMWTRISLSPEVSAREVMDFPLGLSEGEMTT